MWAVLGFILGFNVLEKQTTCNLVIPMWMLVWIKGIYSTGIKKWFIQLDLHI